MQIRQIGPINFKRLYISKENYTKYQKEAINDIEKKCTYEHIYALEDKGYDVYVNGDTYFNYEVYVYAAGHESPDAFRIGCYCNNFDINDVYRAIDKKETQDHKKKAICRAIIGSLWGLLLAGAVITGILRKNAGTEDKVIQKAKTELTDTISKIR